MPGAEIGTGFAFDELAGVSRPGEVLAAVVTAGVRAGDAIMTDGVAIFEQMPGTKALYVVACYRARRTCLYGLDPGSCVVMLCRTWRYHIWRASDQAAVSDVQHPRRVVFRAACKTCRRARSALHASVRTIKEEWCADGVKQDRARSDRGNAQVGGCRECKVS